MGKYFSVKLICIIFLVAVSVVTIRGEIEPTINGEPDITLRLAESLPKNNPVTVAMYRFAELVESNTQGRVTVKVYASAQLGQESETIEQARLGIIDFARTNAVVLANVSPSVGVLTLPYIYRDQEHKYKVLDGAIGRDIRTDLRDVGLIGFDYLEAGNRSFYTRADKPINTLADMRGLKIRVQPAPIMIRMIELLGAVPTPMNYGEVYSAIQTGIVDGAENDYVSFATSGHYDVAKNYVEDNHLSPPAVLLMNLKKYQSLPTQYQKAISAAAHDVALFERELMNEANRKAKGDMLEAGVSITSIDSTPFRQAMQPIYDEFPAYSDLLGRIREVE